MPITSLGHLPFLRPLRLFASFASPVTGPSSRIGEKHIESMGQIMFGKRVPC
jgi:hypothetical protein